MSYSRKIGLQDGTQVPIQGGRRLTGRVGSFDVGMVDIQTEAGEHRCGVDVFHRPARRLQHLLKEHGR